MKIGDALRRLDAYPRTLEDFSVRTVSGAAGKCVRTNDKNLTLIIVWFFIFNSNNFKYQYCGNIDISRIYGLYDT